VDIYSVFEKITESGPEIFYFRSFFFKD